MAVIAALLCLGCNGSTSLGTDDGGGAPSEIQGPPAAETEWKDVVQASSWGEGDPASDPFDHRPLRGDCDSAGWLVEDGHLEVDTGRCNYLWLQQPTLVEIEPGDTLRLELRHFDLTAIQPAEAHVALVLDGAVPWEAEISIPHWAQVLTPEWDAVRPVAVGSMVGLHLHNHGQNSWRLVHVQVRQ